jgi:hypothetical protein
VRFYEILLEYNKEITKRQFGKKLATTVQSSPDKELATKFQSEDEIAEYLISEFEKYDPTPNKQYTPWIAKEYIAKNIRRLEDLSRIKEALKVYHQYKNTKIFKELFPLFPQYKDIGKLTADELENIAEKLDHAAGMATTQDKGEAKEVYNDDKVRVIRPLDQQASCYYGQGTRWCTAATKGDNMFDAYAKGGPLFIIIPKNPKYKGEKYQLAYDSQQFMNEKDDPVLLGKLREFPGFAKFLESLYPDIKDNMRIPNEDVLGDINRAIVEKSKEWQDEYFGSSAARPNLRWGDLSEEEKKMRAAVDRMENWTPESIIRDITFWGEMGWMNLENLTTLYNDYAEEYFPSSIADKFKKLDIAPDVLLKKNSNK